jgi:hypothetical protein
MALSGADSSQAIRALVAPLAAPEIVLSNTR